MLYPGNLKQKEGAHCLIHDSLSLSKIIIFGKGKFFLKNYFFFL